jgi:hypothetical protein
MGLFERLAILVALMAMIAWIDWRRRGAESTKWREYGFLIAAALLGSLFGMSLDNLTATLSPEFFIYGKGIEAGDGFRGRVTYFGFHAGLLAGAIVGGLFLLANNKRSDRPSVTYRRLFWFAWRPVLLAIAGMPPLAALFCFVDPLRLGERAIDFLTPEQQRWFLVVLGINVGGYLGGSLGTIWGVLRIRKMRKMTISTPESPHHTGESPR